MFTLSVTSMLLAMVTVPIIMYLFNQVWSCSCETNFGRIPGMLCNTRFPSLYFILIRFEFSLRFDLSILFCFFRVIVAQSVLHCGGKSYPFHIQAELVKHIVFVTVLLIANVVAAKNSSQGFPSSESTSSRSKIRNKLPGTWWMRFVIALAVDSLLQWHDAWIRFHRLCPQLRPWISW